MKLTAALVMFLTQDASAATEASPRRATREHRRNKSYTMAGLPSEGYHQQNKTIYQKTPFTSDWSGKFEAVDKRYKQATAVTPDARKGKIAHAEQFVAQKADKHRKKRDKRHNAYKRKISQKMKKSNSFPADLYISETYKVSVPMEQETPVPDEKVSEPVKRHVLKWAVKHHKYPQFRKSANGKECPKNQTIKHVHKITVSGEPFLNETVNGSEEHYRVNVCLPYQDGKKNKTALLLLTQNKKTGWELWIRISKKEKLNSTHQTEIPLIKDAVLGHEGLVVYQIPFVKKDDRGDVLIFTCKLNKKSDSVTLPDGKSRLLKVKIKKSDIMADIQ
jgi:hypothetical protein